MTHESPNWNFCVGDSDLKTNIWLRFIDSTTALIYDRTRLARAESYICTVICILAGLNILVNTNLDKSEVDQNSNFFIQILVTLFTARISIMAIVTEKNPNSLIVRKL